MWSAVTKRVSVFPVIETGTRVTEPEEDEDVDGHVVPDDEEDDDAEAVEAPPPDEDDDALDEDDGVPVEVDAPPVEELEPVGLVPELEQADATAPPAVAKSAIRGAAERTRRRALRIVCTRVPTRQRWGKLTTTERARSR